MSSDITHMPLGRINEREQEILLLRLDDLLKFLGAPGDWGYGTKLGVITQVLRGLRSDIANAMPGEDR